MRPPLPEGLRVFVVEDESLVLMNLESMLEDFGCTVVGHAMSAAQLAASITRGVDADLAVLDVNLGGILVFDHARGLVGSGMRIVFATGYGQGGIPAEWRDWPILQKPYTSEQLAGALAQALEGQA